MYTTVITSFNRRHCIERAIDSALRELPGHEIIIVDDASSDGTPHFIKERYANEIRQGALILNCLQKNIGVSGAKNIGYECSKSDWIIFLDSDDYYTSDAGKRIDEELKQSADCPVVFFRCITNTGEFVGVHKGNGVMLDLRTYLQHTSYGEALTAVNKKLAGFTPPYIQSLRGYEGIGCARLIYKFGSARLSKAVARVYDTTGKDRLSVNSGFFLRMPLLAKGHFLLISEFVCYLSIQKIFILLAKVAIYFVLGNLYQLLSKK
jgi:glycosyltransferase involved in cell wall biosynthesis